MQFVSCRMLVCATSMLFFSSSPMVWGHGAAAPSGANVSRAIEFPDVGELRTLVVDLHTHTVFSDGHVWPKIRVEEALRDGLDAYAVTEHLEYQPHLADIPHPDRNRAFDEAARAAQATDLLVIRGTEITREPPAGHINAVFIEDANPMLRAPAVAEPFDAIEYYRGANAWPAEDAVAVANAQGAFVFWNHPHWARQAPDGIARITDFHKKLVRAKHLHGIEVANGDDYSEEAFAIALKHNLVPIGVSDVHDLVDWDYQPHLGGHRPVNLVFAVERSQESIKQALFAGQTVIWFKNLLIGREEFLQPLLETALTFTSQGYLPDTTILALTVRNNSDAEFELRNLTKLTFANHADIVRVPAHGSVELAVKSTRKTAEFALQFEVLNALVAPKKHPILRFDTKVSVPGD